MTEIDKMFENVWVEPIDSKLEPMGTLKFSVDDIGTTWTREQYMKEVPIYPPFTAGKQIELVCFLINRGVELSFNCEQGKINTQAIQRSLAGLINNLWKSLTNQEKEEIKEILDD